MSIWCWHGLILSNHWQNSPENGSWTGNHELILFWQWLFWIFPDWFFSDNESLTTLLKWNSSIGNEFETPPEGNTRVKKSPFSSWLLLEQERWGWWQPSAREHLFSHTWFSALSSSRAKCVFGVLGVEEGCPLTKARLGLTKWRKNPSFNSFPQFSDFSHSALLLNSSETGEFKWDQELSLYDSSISVHQLNKSLKRWFMLCPLPILLHLLIPFSTEVWSRLWTIKIWIYWILQSKMALQHSIGGEIRVNVWVKADSKAAHHSIYSIQGKSRTCAGCSRLSSVFLSLNWLLPVLQHRWASQGWWKMHPKITGIWRKVFFLPAIKSRDIN